MHIGYQYGNEGKKKFWKNGRVQLIIHTAGFEETQNKPETILRMSTN